MKVHYSSRSLLQLEEIHRYIAQFNPRAAAQVVTRVDELCQKLGDFPGMGHMTEQPGVRVLPVVRYPYLIFYLIMPEHDEVRILRLRHGRRKPLPADEIQ